MATQFGLGLGLLLCTILFTARAYPADQNPQSLALTVEPLPDRTISVRWRSNETEFQIYRLRTDGREKPQMLNIPWTKGVPGWGPNPGQEQQFIDTNVVPFTSYRYVVMLLPSNREFAFKDVVASGTEIRIEGHVFLRDIVGISAAHKLTLISGSQIITEGKPLVLRLIELNSYGGTIRSFLSSHEARPGFLGRKGGIVDISARRGTGTNLMVIADGETGGRGDDAKETFASIEFKDLRGEVVARGKTRILCQDVGLSSGWQGGDAGAVQIHLVEESSLSIHISAEGGLGGKGGKNCKGDYAGTGRSGRRLEWCLKVADRLAGSC